MVTKAVFKCSSERLGQLPKDNLHDIAFIGRSNVGKSSLINMLTRHKGLAKVSSTPGKTKLINHFLVNDEWYLVDLPGYGYSKRSTIFIDFPNGIHCVTTAGTLRDGITASFFIPAKKTYTK